METLLSQLNLHHLRALDVLLETRSVTTAAARLGVSPSALSHALRGMRDVLGDPLLVRGKGGMVPTERGAALAGPLRRALRDLSVALDGGGAFVPARSQRTFRLAMADSFAFAVLPALLLRLRAAAPGIDLSVFPVSHEQLPSALESGTIDLAITVEAPQAPGLRMRVLGRDEMVCAVRTGHPDVGAVMDLDTFCRLPHALLSPQGYGPGSVDVALAAVGRERRVQLRIRYFLVAPMVVAASDLVVSGPQMLLLRFAAIVPLRLLPVPVPLDSFPVQLVWHERGMADAGARWLRQQVAAVWLSL